MRQVLAISRRIGSRSTAAFGPCRSRPELQGRPDRGQKTAERRTRGRPAHAYNVRFSRHTPRAGSLRARNEQPCYGNGNRRNEEPGIELPARSDREQSVGRQRLGHRTPCPISARLHGFRAATFRCAQSSKGPVSFRYRRALVARARPAQQSRSPGSKQGWLVSLPPPQTVRPQPSFCGCEGIERHQPKRSMDGRQPSQLAVSLEPLEANQFTKAVVE